MYYTADVWDADPENTGLCSIDFRNYGRRKIFWGPCSTLKVCEDYRVASELLSVSGNGRVLIIDGRGIDRVALVGATMAARAVSNGWSGVIVYGAIRDTDEISELDLGVKATATTARSSPGPTEHFLGAPVTFGGITFCEGDWVYADSDSVLIRKNEYKPKE